MYHRFEENKYPSTNIRMNIFLEHIAAIKNNGFEFYNPKLFNEEFSFESPPPEFFIKVLEV